MIGPARIGRVRFSKTGKSLYYQNRTYQTLSGSGFKANYFDTETGEECWISGCKKDGSDALYIRTPWKLTTMCVKSIGWRFETVLI